MKLDTQALTEVFNTALREYMSHRLTPLELLEPMHYSLESGGKRIRPVLLLAMLAATGVDWIEYGLPSAIAVELIHTYSLIHDDLPAMDNDTLRRGQLTTHKRFGEATAILAGDALLTDAFDSLAQDALNTSDQKIQLIQSLSQAAGSTGMVAGQLADIQGEGQTLTLEELQWIHDHKTGALFNFSAQAAITIAGLESTEANLLLEWTRVYGRTYQIANDWREVALSPEAVGKEEASDQRLDKATYPQLIGIEATQQLLDEKITSLHQLIEQLVELTGKDYHLLTPMIDLLTPDKGATDHDQTKS